MVEAAEPSKTIRITDRDVRILGDHVACFRMTTYEALQRIYWPDGEINAAKSWVRRMKEAGYLSGAPLYGAHRYFYPTAQAVNEFQLEHATVGFRKAVQLAEAYGILDFCCLGHRPLRKLSPLAFRENFPELVLGRQVPSEYYLDDEGGRRRLGYIFVDTRRQLNKIRARIRTLISERLGSEAWKLSIIQKRRFVIAILTIRPQRQKQIAQYVEDLHPEIEFRFACIPALGDLLPGKS